MTRLLLVGLGSFVGGVLRYALSNWVHKALDNPWFPYGTLSVNVIGCLLIGFLAGLAETRSLFTSDVRLFVFIGILGGFTTYSSFAFESFSLIRNTQLVAATMNVGLHVILGLVGVWVGSILSRML